MPPNARSDDDDRRRVEEQIRLIETAHPGEVAWDSADDEPSEFSYLYDPAVLLVRSADVGQVVDVLNGTGDFVEDIDGRPEEEGGRVRTFPPDDSGRPPVELVQLLLPSRGDGDDTHRVPLALDALDDQGVNDDEVSVAAPDHWLSLSPVGGTRLCPALEPAETGLDRPWPDLVADAELGRGIRVSVVDSGWHAAAADRAVTDFLRGVTGEEDLGVETAADGQGATTLTAYAGHGTFIAGIVRCLAPSAQVRIERFIPGSGALRESAMVRQLRQALGRDDPPHLINLSAGARSRKNRPLLSFEVFHQQDLSEFEDCLLVAAAGNDGSSRRFWPAAFPWALGVGSLDRDGQVSSFSNYGESAELYALGRNLVNAFPNGTYVCREAPDTGDVREFRRGLARWSGTSFAAPVVVGLIAAAITGGGNPRAAGDQLIAQAGSAVDADGNAVPAVPLSSL